MAKTIEDHNRSEIESLIEEVQGTVTTLRERGIGSEPMYERILRIDQVLRLASFLDDTDESTDLRTMQLMVAVCIAAMVEAA